MLDPEWRCGLFGRGKLIGAAMSRHAGSATHAAVCCMNLLFSRNR